MAYMPTCEHATSSRILTMSISRLFPLHTLSLSLSLSLSLFLSLRELLVRTSVASVRSGHMVAGRSEGPLNSAQRPDLRPRGWAPQAPIGFLAFLFYCVCVCVCEIGR